MNRRNFLIACGSIGAVGLGGRLVQQAYAREHLNRKLFDTALPRLISSHNGESLRLPREGREGLKQWFHGKCLNSASFVQEVCTGETLTVLRTIDDEKARFELLYDRFCNRVVSHTEIMNRIETLHAEAGDVIDLNWSSCCFEISQRWSSEIRQCDPEFTLGNLPDRLNPIIRQELDGTLHRLASSDPGHDPMHKLLNSLGRTAMELIPMIRHSGNLTIPAFLVAAFIHVADYLYETSKNPIIGYQAELSARIAHLGSHVANEFETSIKNQLAQMHAIQDAAVKGQASEYANRVVPILV